MNVKLNLTIIFPPWKTFCFVCFSQCTGMAWDKDGDTLAVVNDKNGVVTLWDANTTRTSQIDSGFR